jgi:prephenate dehydrogenase
MWRDVCLANREAILGMMRRYTEDLRLIEDAIEQGDGEALLDIFTRAKAARDRFCQ